MRKACLVCGTPTRNSRCGKHQKPGRANSTQRGYDADWRRLVRDVLQRDGGICWRCHLPGSDSGDHVVPLAHGGERLDPANVRACHSRCNSIAGGKTRRLD